MNSDDSREYCIQVRQNAARHARANGDSATADYLETRVREISELETRSTASKTMTPREASDRLTRLNRLMGN